MSNQFFVRLFSTQSQHLYKNNTKTSFTCHLPKPIVLDASYECGLCSIYHDKIVGVKDQPENLSHFVAANYELDQLIDVIKHSPNIALYDDHYFEKFDNDEYYDVNNEGSIFTKFTQKVDHLKARAAAPTESFFRINPVDLNPSNILSLSDKNRFGSIAIRKSGDYRVSALLEEYLLGIIFEHLYVLYGKNAHIIQKEKEKATPRCPQSHEELNNQIIRNIEPIVRAKAMEFIKPIKLAAAKANVTGSHYVAIYTDIISPYINGNAMSKILFLTDRAAKAEPLTVTNVEYFPVEKQFISDISILICNDRQEQLVFRSVHENFIDADKPTSITLHFRKITH